MCKSILSFFYFFFLTCGLFAQNTATNNKVLLPPPDVASLVKFSEVPVSNYNGTAQVNIPLYEIKVGDISFPISLNYHTGGIKVSEEASCVGLGWNLSAIGAIYENIVGKPDAIEMQYTPDIYPNTSVSFVGGSPASPFTNVLERGSIFRDKDGNCTSFPPLILNSSIPPSDINDQPDIYILNAGGYSSKFIKPLADLEFRSIDGQNIKFSTIGTNTDAFEAIMPNGSRYIFSDMARTITTLSASTDINRSFFLSKIISPSGKLIIFKYKDINTVPKTKGQQSLDESWFSDDLPDPSPRPPYSTSLSPSPVIENLYLDEIDFDNGYVKFSMSNRSDLNGLKIDKMEVFQNEEPVAFKKIYFNYDYFIGEKWQFGDYITESTFNTGTYVDPYVTEEYRKKRLKLTSLIINNNPPYSFEYENTPLPYKTSYAQDLWGYFNGNTIKTLLPDYNQLGFTDINIPTSLLAVSSYNGVKAVRKANFEFAKAGSLIDIRYPTGGHTTFEYEPNAIGRTTGIHTQLIDHQESVADASTGIQQLVFDIPDVGYYQNTGTYQGPINPGKISVFLWCCQPAPCGFTCPSGISCEGFTGTVGGGINTGLFAMIEKYNNVTGLWMQEDVFDKNNALLYGACESSINRFFVPGHYRITANYPDFNAPGLLGSKMATIGITYKITTSTTTQVTNVGPGIRIGSITDFVSDSKVASKRKFTYSDGALTTKPIFYRYGNENTLPALPSSCSVPTWGTSFGPFGDYCANLPGSRIYRRSYLSLYSNPVASYSYSANGSLVGYDSVTVTNVDAAGTENGQSIYVYNNHQDMTNYYSTMLPGTPSSGYMDNGTLKEITERKKNGTNIYLPVKSIFFTYGIGNLQVKWGHRFEWVHQYAYIAEHPPSNCYEVQFAISNFLVPIDQAVHFYPIVSGHVHLTNKVEKYYNGGVELTTLTDYVYNSKNQLREEVTYSSKGVKLSKETYYPSDFNVSSGFLKDMVDRNMLDYPIETISKTANLTTGSNYNEYYQHDNIISPLKTHLFTTHIPVSFTPAVPGNTMDHRYNVEKLFTYDANGNIAEAIGKDGIQSSYGWAYSNALPVVQALNAQQKDIFYTGFEEADGNSSINDSKAGRKSRTGSFSKNLTGLTDGNYILSYWQKNSATWVLQTSQVNVSGGAYSINIDGSNQIDELRFYPQKAQLTTYTYDPLLGMTSVCGKDDRFSYYVYDDVGRLSEIKDEKYNVLKKYEYKYNDNGCTAPVISSIDISPISASSSNINIHYNYDPYSFACVFFIREVANPSNVTVTSLSCNTVTSISVVPGKTYLVTVVTPGPKCQGGVESAPYTIAVP